MENLNNPLVLELLVEERRAELLQAVAATRDNTPQPGAAWFRLSLSRFLLHLALHAAPQGTALRQQLSRS